MKQTKLKAQKRKSKNIPKVGEDAYYNFDRIPKSCGYEKKFKYSFSLGTYGVPGELIHWCIAKCKHRWGWWFKNHESWYSHWNPEQNEAYMSFASSKEAFRFWFEVGLKHYGDNDPDEH